MMSAVYAVLLLVYTAHMCFPTHRILHCACILYTIYCILYTINCMLCSTHSTLCTIHALYARSFIHCTMVISFHGHVHFRRNYLMHKNFTFLKSYSFCLLIRTQFPTVILMITKELLAVSKISLCQSKAVENSVIFISPFRKSIFS